MSAPTTPSTDWPPASTPGASAAAPAAASGAGERAERHLAGRDLSTRDLGAWNQALNETHAMAAMRARAGRIVTAIEARRRTLVCGRVLATRPAIVVDVGCEDGWIAEGYLGDARSEILERVVLADVDPEVLAKTTLREHPRVTTVVCDALTPRALAAQLGARGADVLVLSALLEHLPDPAAALHALAPLLAPGGRFVIYLPADGPILAAKAVLKATRLGALVRGLSLEPAPGHLHRFARKDVARLLAVLAPRGAVTEAITFDPICLGYIASVRIP